MHNRGKVVKKVGFGHFATLLESVPLYTGLAREFCNWETFTGECDAGHVVVMKSAHYARMNHGRCVQPGFDQFGKPYVMGCSEDILRYCLLHRMYIALSADLKRDYCNWETFSAQCAPGHTILMTTANYGRMGLGRCIPETYDREGKPSVIGCAENIMRYMISPFVSERFSCISDWMYNSYSQHKVRGLLPSYTQENNGISNIHMMQKCPESYCVIF